MARNFDSVRKSHQPIRSVAPHALKPHRQVPSLPALPNEPQTALPKTRTKTYWALTFLVVGLALVGVAVFAKYSSEISQPTTSAVQSGNISATSSQETGRTTDQTNTTTGSTVPSTSQALTVQIYESGAGEEAYQQVSQKIKSQNFSVEQLGKSQFEYDKTYIWYRPEYETKAKEIGALLEGREVSYKESQITGVFDVLVYVGKK